MELVLLLVLEHCSIRCVHLVRWGRSRILAHVIVESNIVAKVARETRLRREHVVLVTVLAMV